MRAAGVHLADGRLVWIEAGEVTLGPLDRVVVRLAEGEHHGVIVVTPEQCLRPPDTVDGVLAGWEPFGLPIDDCSHLPGAHMPPLGSRLDAGGTRGMVIGLDPVERTVTVTPDDEGPEVTVAADTALDPDSASAGS